MKNIVLTSFIALFLLAPAFSYALLPETQRYRQFLLAPDID